MLIFKWNFRCRCCRCCRCCLSTLMTTGGKAWRKIVVRDTIFYFQNSTQAVAVLKIVYTNNWWTALQFISRLLNMDLWRTTTLRLLEILTSYFWHYYQFSMHLVLNTRKKSIALNRWPFLGLSQWFRIMYLLTEWEGRTGKYLARGHGVRTERSEVPAPWTRAKYFPVRPDLIQSISILLYDHRAFPFFFSFFFFNFRVIKFVMFAYVALFDRKVGIYIATKLF